MPEIGPRAGYIDLVADLPLRAKLAALGVGVAVVTLAVQSGDTLTGDSDTDVPEQIASFEKCDTEANITSEPTLVESAHEDEASYSRAFSFVHTVKEGDKSLTDIAKCYFPDTDLGVRSIVAANPDMTNPNMISIGQDIKIWVTDAETRLSNEDRSIEEISDYTGFDATSLAIVNGVDEDGEIKAGKPIVLPRQQAELRGESSHVVASGDSYSSIADQFDADIVLVQAANTMDASALQPGQIVVVPSGERGSVSTEERAKRSKIPEDEPTPPSAELPPEEQLREYVTIYGPYAQRVEEKYGIPQAVTLAMSYHESEYGRSSLATEAKNFHGLKANEGWSGATFVKKTEEYLSDEQLAKAEAEGKKIEMIDTDGTTSHIYIVDTFRKFDTVKDGFMGFGEKLKSEGNYPDAFDTDDPYEFLSRLVDENGPPYATDPEYYDVVSEKIRRVEQILFNESVEPTPEAPATELPGSTAEKIAAVSLSTEGFEAFKASIDTSYMDDAAELENYNPETNGVPQEASELFIWHFTVVYYNGPGNGITEPIGDHSDVNHFLTSTNGSGVGVQWYIDRSGKTYQLLDPTSRTVHIPPHSSVSTGVEIESDTQDHISTAQYESAAYLAAHNIIELDLLRDGKSLDEVLYGHGELRTIDRLTDPSLQVRGDFPAAESLALRNKVAELLDELGY
jgi:flagellum-specific peptidoglycan hydrolase FlgJ